MVCDTPPFFFPFFAKSFPLRARWNVDIVPDAVSGVVVVLAATPARADANLAACAALVNAVFNN